MQEDLLSEEENIEYEEDVENQGPEKNKYEMVDGQPVFDDEEMNRQYDNYMVQLQNFLLSDAQEAD